MATVPACEVCGRSSPPGVLPPEVEPMLIRDATADYSGHLCRDCAKLPLPTILEHFAGAPGGTVEGRARGPYLIVRGDDEAPATE